MRQLNIQETQFISGGYNETVVKDIFAASGASLGAYFSTFVYMAQTTTYSAAATVTTFTPSMWILLSGSIFGAAIGNTLGQIFVLLAPNDKG